MITPECGLLTSFSRGWLAETLVMWLPKMYGGDTFFFNQNSNILQYVKSQKYKIYLSKNIRNLLVLDQRHEIKPNQ
jgi:hypothetical protein